MTIKISKMQRLAQIISMSLISTACFGSDTKVAFDIPSKVECVDVTPKRFREVHPSLKVIEATFHISASFVEGSESSTSDFVYTVFSPDMRMRVAGFLPNTTMESSAAGDRIEVTDKNESSDANAGDVSVGYSLISLGASKGISSKHSESNRYQRVAPRNLVLASGTVNRGHGVFYKLRPSAQGSLEGAKEFTVLCTVPREWRGDWCKIVCSARTHKKSSNASITCVESAHVGLYLADDREASELADALTRVQIANGGALAKELNKEAIESVESLYSNTAGHSAKTQSGESLFQWRFKSAAKEISVERSKRSLLEIESRFSELAAAAEPLYESVSTR